MGLWIKSSYVWTPSHTASAPASSNPTSPRIRTDADLLSVQDEEPSDAGDGQVGKTPTPGHSHPPVPTQLHYHLCSFTRSPGQAKGDLSAPTTPAHSGSTAVYLGTAPPREAHPPADHCLQ